MELYSLPLAEKDKPLNAKVAKVKIYQTRKINVVPHLVSRNSGMILTDLTERNTDL